MRGARAIALPPLFPFMRTFSTEEYLWGLNMVLNVWVGLRGFQTGLARPFRWFHVFLLVSTFVSLLLFYFHSIQENRNLYGEIFLFWSYCAPIFYFLFVEELNKSVLKPFPAIEAASRSIQRMLWLGLALLAIGWYFYLTAGSSVPFPRLRAALSYQQAASTGYCLYLLCFLGFITFMPVPMTRMRLLHSFLLGAFFASLSASRLIVLFNDFSWARLAASYVGIVGANAVLVAWLLWMREEADETDLITARGAVAPELAEAYLERLALLNDTLARSGPRLLR